MTRLGICCLLGAWVCWTAPVSLLADAPSPAPDFKQVYQLVREHLFEANEQQLNAAVVNGLISALAPKVSIVGQSTDPAQAGAVLLSKTSLFEGPIVYLRVGHVESGLDKAVLQAWREAAATNKLAGLVLDLRFTPGTDYSAAAATADLFIKKDQPLLDWGKGMVRAAEKTDAISVPVAILVNEKTAAAAEALAAVLRQTSVGLVLGSRTAGQAMIAQEYPLDNGQRLRIATAPIQLGDASRVPSQGITPDIAINVPLADERAYYADAFRDLAAAPPSAGPNPASGPTRVRRPRFNEAELVRERRDGPVTDGDLAGTTTAEPDKPVVHDPVLGRALDFLKGLTLVRQTRS